MLLLIYCLEGISEVNLRGVMPVHALLLEKKEVTQMIVWKQFCLCGILLLNGGCAISEIFSPGCQLAFSSERKGELDEDVGHDIYLIDCDGENKVQLTDDPGNNNYPDWSPDGKKIVFESDRDGNREIYIMNADGSEQRNLSKHPANDRRPAWSPDGKWIAFSSDRGRLGNDEIFIQEMKGEKMYQITDDLHININPVWSPDGDRLAYVQWNCPISNLVIVTLEDLSFEVIRLNMGCLGDLDWSPNGLQISFCTSVVKDEDIFLVTLEGLEIMQLTEGESGQLFMNYGAEWSPDGNQIAYIHSPLEWSYSEIYIMNSDGSESIAVTNDGVWINALAWRP